MKPFPLFAAVLLAIPGVTEAGDLPLVQPDARTPSDLSVLTYNLHGLPWPFAQHRTPQLRQIGAELLALRRAGRQPHVLLLQEAFTKEARLVGIEGGYAYAADGPPASERDDPPMTAEDRRFAAGARLLKGEKAGKIESSGLRIFSDYPIVKVQRMAFPSFACAGYDCLANKGVLLVTIDVPGKGPVQVATTHLNSRTASGTPDARSLAAYQMQVAALDRFFRANLDPALPLIFGGDFNVGDAPGRRPALIGTVSGWGAAAEGLRACAASATPIEGEKDVPEILRKARDWQFYRGGNAALRPTRAAVVFGRAADGRMLSDHLGFAVAYDWAQKGSG